jgi:hypothetical protein
MMGRLGVVMAMMMVGVVGVPIVPMGGLSRNCKHNKTGGRDKQSHYA